MTAFENTGQDRRPLELLIERFEHAWLNQAEPDVRQFVNAVPLDQRRLVAERLVTIDIEQRWLCAAQLENSTNTLLPPQPKLEDYFDRLPELGPLDSVELSLVAAEMRARCRSGNRPALDEYERRFPQHRDALPITLDGVLSEITTRKQPVRDTPGTADNQTPRTVLTLDRSSSSSSDLTSSGEFSAQQSSADLFRKLVPGEEFGPFLLLKELGQGGCGVVFLAAPRHTDLDPGSTRIVTTANQVALKVIRPDRVLDAKVFARFQQEIRAIMPLAHPNVARAIDSGSEQGLSYLSMEYVDGEPLDVILQQGRLAIANVAEIGRQLAEGLQHIADNGRTHRDLKPSNVLLSSEGHIKIVDLGLAALKENEDAAERLTSLHDVIGTPDYMAPEQWTDPRTVTIAADIYSLGCTMFALLTGEPPFLTLKFRDKMEAHQVVEPPLLSTLRSDVPRELAMLIQRCLSKQPENRFADPAELAKALTPFCQTADLAAMVSTARTNVFDRPRTETHPGAIASPISITEALQSTPSINSASTPGDGAIETFEATIMLHQQDLERTLGETSIKLDPINASRRSKSGNTAASAPSDPHRQSGPSSSDRRSGPSGPSSGSRSGVSNSRNLNSSIGNAVARYRDVEKHPDADYEVKKALGKGGMGIVVLARQSSMDRNVAVKTILAEIEQTQDIWDRFLSEAVVTGSLEHPNIVPIYDVGVNANGDLFYAMKEIRGREWEKVLKDGQAAVDAVPDEAKPAAQDKFETDNINILLRVADAIAFSHAHGIVHRDLKPRNVMIGEFGEVLVMDWGLALPLKGFAKKIAVTEGPAGTPAYMAPEMVTGPIHQISEASDIYLLGAILFRILTRRSPHAGATGFACLSAAGRNEIVPTDRHDEFMRVALKAMSTAPTDRYPSVIAFQEAIAECRAHMQSISLAQRAEKHLAHAQESRDYREFQAALIAYDEALKSWPANASAQTGRHVASRSYAQVAHAKRDFDLALSQLDPHNPETESLRTRVLADQAESASRAARLQRAKRLIRNLAAAVFSIVACSAMGMAWLWRNEQVAHAESLKRFEQAQAAIDRLAGVADDLEFMPRLSRVRINLLTMVSQHYEELSRLQVDDPELQLACAEATLRLGDIHAKLADHERALLSFEQVLQRTSPATSRVNARLQHRAARLHVTALLRRARSERAFGRFKSATESTQLALNRLQQLPPQIAEALRAEAHVELAQNQEHVGRFQDAVAATTTAIGCYETASTLASQDRQLDLDAGRATAFTLQGRILARINPTKAEAALRASIALWENLRLAAEDHPNYLEGNATAHVELANLHRRNSPAAITIYEQAVVIYGELVAARPEIPRYHLNRALTRTDLAMAQQALGDARQARDNVIESLQELGLIEREYADQGDFLAQVAAMRTVLGSCLRELEDFESSEKHLQAARQLFADLGRSDDGQDDPLADPLLREQAAINFSELGLLKMAQGDWEQAREHFTAAIARLQSSSADFETPLSWHNSLAWIHLHLGNLLWLRGNEDEARPHFVAAIKIREQHSTTPEQRYARAWLLSHCEALEYQNLALAAELLEPLPDLTTRPQPALLLASVKARLGQPEAARKLIQQTTALAPDHGETDWLHALIPPLETTKSSADWLKAGDEKLTATLPGSSKLKRFRNQIEAAIHAMK